MRPYSKGQKNDFRDAEAIAEAVQRPTMKFVATKTGDQLDLQALHRVRERLVSQRTGISNQIRAFLLDRGIAVRQGLRFLRAELPGILARRCDVLSPRMVCLIEDLAGDWRRLDERIESLSGEIVVIRASCHCKPPLRITCAGLITVVLPPSTLMKRHSDLGGRIVVDARASGSPPSTRCRKFHASRRFLNGRRRRLRKH